MHMQIGIMVRALNKEDAGNSIEGALDNISGDGKPFDYYNEEVVAVEKFSLSGGKGKKLVSERMDLNKAEFMHNIKEVRNAIFKYTDEELFDIEHKDGIPHQEQMFRYYCYHTGEYVGTTCWLYDEWGSGLRTPDEFAERIADDDGKHGDWYIVIVDVHC